MDPERTFINSIDLDCSIAITSFGEGSYKVYYSPDGCSSNVNIDHFEGFVFHPFQITSETPALYLQASTTFIANDINTVKRFLKSLSADNKPKLDLNNYIYNQEEYENLLTKVISQISNHLPKVVISRIEESNSKPDPLDVFQSFCERYPKNGNYLFYSKESGLWLGSSPETLIDVSDGHGYTCALAGTKETHEEWGKKEEKEQQFVEKYIDEIFHSNNIAFSSEKDTISLKGIDHIKTSYSFKTDDSFSLKSFLEEIHPTPAVAGIPKSKAIQFIADNELHSRKYYTGYFGSVSRRETKLFVNLRCLQSDGTKDHYYLGGGITKSSNAQKEYEETVRKLHSIK